MISWQVISRLRKRQGPARSGKSATAILTSISNVAVPGPRCPGRPRRCVTLPASPPLRRALLYRPHAAGFRDAQRRAAIAVIGAVLPVRVDARDGTWVAVDVAEFDGRPQSNDAGASAIPEAIELTCHDGRPLASAEACRKLLACTYD